MRKGKRLQTPYFTLVASPRYGREASFTVIVSNKSVKTAPKRARIKRRLRSMIREVYLQEHRSNYDCIFIARANVENTPWKDLVLTGQKCFDQLHHLST
ncbi:MAG: ribonuclease P protein component [Candidatus Abawacabacteria bacterium RBG_16_42_10]|uniref:Ribonuclease P protein component n=1 Tax=Candidatus Abawacabacteria bacterium RBG_16_42_10 TaxID=1817814 RepID=A0A1F4XK17_9BACT|nr:MAG: ribonuclease P protein component [Candidatus Abawacabacteria bacterium RBG_16_42_10]